MSQSYDYFPSETHSYSSTSRVKGSSLHIFTDNAIFPQVTGNFGAWEGPLLSYTITSLTDDTSAFQLPSPPISPLLDCFSTGSPERMALSVPSPTDYIFPTQPAPNSVSVPVTNPTAPIYVEGPMSLSTPVMKMEENRYCGEQQHFENSLPRSFRPKMPQRSSSRSWRVARHAHTIIERNYRDRLNTKISELSAYLFNDSICSDIKPSKSTVISQATDRLLHLEKQNQELLSEVEALKKQITLSNSSDKGQANQKMRASDNDEGEADTELDR